MIKPRLQWDCDKRAWVVVPILNNEHTALIKNSWAYVLCREINRRNPVKKPTHIWSEPWPTLLPISSVLMDAMQKSA